MPVNVQSGVLPYANTIMENNNKPVVAMVYGFDGLYLFIYAFYALGLTISNKKFQSKTKSGNFVTDLS